MEERMQGEKRLMAGLSAEGFALVVEMLANDVIDLEAIVAYVHETDGDCLSREGED